MPTRKISGKEQIPAKLMAQRLSPKKMDTSNRVQILDEAACVSLSANTLANSMDPIIRTLAMGK